MKVKDERAWAEQLSEFEADEVSKKFGEFLLTWGNEADQILSDLVEDEDGAPLGPAQALSKALEVTEQTKGFLSVEWIAQMLLVITEHWVHGEQLFEGLSFIEKRLVEQATAMKLAELQEAAKMPVES